MPKKQKPNIASFRRWDLARGGTNRLMPRGTNSEPWPSWITKTFVNENLLQEDPLELRDELFGCQRHPRETWSLVDNLLFAIEHNAKNVLKELPLPFEVWDYCNSQTPEDKFYDRFARCKTLTHKQKNAIAALRSIGLIRAASHASLHHGRWISDLHRDHTYDSLSVAKIIMETATLIMAAIRGELWEDVWPHTESGIVGEATMRKNLGKGVEARKTNKQAAQKLCREIATQSKSKSVQGRAAFVKKQIEEKKSLPYKLSLRTIRDYLKK